MAQWGNTDDAANSVIWAASLVNKTANTLNQTDLFGNTTASAFVNNAVVGQFGLDTTEINVSNSSVVSFTVISPGSGYASNAAITVGGNATGNAHANSIGKIDIVNITLPGNSYSVAPTVTIAAPAAKTFNANTAVAANGFIAIATNKFQIDDKVTYLVADGNTNITELANNTLYTVVGSNSTGVYLSTSKGGTSITLTPSAVSETGHSLTGETATAVAAISGAYKHGCHTGYVLRTVGTGGRAGRVSYETLVAMGSLTGDAEDTVLKDS